MSDKMLRVFNKAVAVVTGAASGIGRGLAEELAKRGSEVVLADLQVEVAEEVAAGIRAGGGKAHAAELNVTDSSAVDALLRGTIDRTGRLDYLFNNAGIGVGGPLHLHRIEDWEQIIGVNLYGVVNGVHSAYPIMRAQGFGHIVNTASVAGLMPSPGTVAYATTKFAVVGLSLSLRAEAASAGVRVSVLCPGAVRTPLLRGEGKYGTIYGDTSRQREMMEMLRPISADQLAHQALNAIARNKAVIVIPSWLKLAWWMNRLAPGLLMFAFEKWYPTYPD